MGDVAVGARSGHDGEENRGRPEGTAGPASVGAPDSGYGSGTEDGRVTNGQSGGNGHNGGTEDEGVGGTPPAAPPAAKKQRSFWKELPILIGIALVLALLIKTFLVQAFSIPSSSMENTLQIGDRVLVDKLTPVSYTHL